MECFLDIATSAKHPYWAFLGTAADVADLAQIENIEVFVASQAEPQVIAWLGKIGEHDLRLHIKLVDEEGGFKTEHFQAEVKQQTDGTKLVFLRR